MLTSKQIRQKFIQYFEEKGHTHVHSSSLVPYNDPTLLFTNAGMNQFKDIFLGLEKRDYKRAVTSQKCVRAGGKHNDLETVGKTARHHTFFEMLGNFSFGDYFKKDAIDFCWTFLTEELGLPKEKLYITIYQDDDEAFQLWHERTGFDESRIFRLGEKDNFWQMGDVGPCGPCSEVHYDRGEDYACDCEDGCALGVCDCDRWLEIWNLVFMQFNRDQDGTLHKLPRPSVDTGMGLERIASVLQKVDTNFDTDLFVPLIQYVEELTGKAYQEGEKGFPFRVIADHARACTFLIGDGVLPSNEGRGYVLRRILRRAVRLGKALGLNTPFLHKLTPKVCDLMGEDYPEIVEQKDFIMEVIEQEEKRFFVTLQEGLKKVEQTIERLKEENSTIIPGKDAFVFYDTYGFPIDLTKDIADENGFSVDLDGFEASMEEQRRLSQSARETADVWELAKTLTSQYGDLPQTEFVGYDTLTSESTIVGIMSDGVAHDFGYDIHAYVLLDRTPFYAQGGGQVGDRGKLYGKDGVFEVRNTIKLPSGHYILEGYIDGRLNLNETAKACVDEEKRLATAKNHTATHLLHKALQIVLGDHVHQAGSLVDEEHLRFDFSHLHAVTKEELLQIEDIVNDEIQKAYATQSAELPFDAAKEEGYIGLFGEKYGEVVRCINLNGYSKELCGGTHVKNVGEIGLFKITSEGSVSAGVRRIEAVTGKAALAYIRKGYAILEEAKDALKAHSYQDILQRLEQEKQEKRILRDEIKTLKQKANSNIVDTLLQDVYLMDDCEVLAAQVDGFERDALRDLADKLRDRITKGAICLASVVDGQAILVAMTKDAPQLHAGKIVQYVAAQIDGKGGGRPDMAQGGGKNIANLSQALSSIKTFLQA